MQRYSDKVNIDLDQYFRCRPEALTVIKEKPEPDTAGCSAVPPPCRMAKPIMDFALLLVVGVGLYFVADWILRALERAAGRIFEQRTLIFFALLLGLALVAFFLIRQLVEL